MPIAINETELMTLLEVTPTWQNIMLAGRHGIGKSQILTRYFKSKGLLVKTLFLGQMSDPGDLLGLPNKDKKTGNRLHAALLVPCRRRVHRALLG